MSISPGVLAWAFFRRQRSGHGAQPGIPLARAYREAAVRFAQAQPPAALPVIGLATEELDEKRREFFHCAGEGGRKQRAQYGISLHMSVERRRQRTASGSAPNGTIEIRGPCQEPIVSKLDATSTR